MEAAMLEAGNMAWSSETTIAQGEYPMDDTRSKLFPGAAPQDFVDVQGTKSKSIKGLKLIRSRALQGFAPKSRLHI
jgi:hypothetical protein